MTVSLGPPGADRWKTVEAIFHAVADQPPGPVRDALVLAQCGHDPLLAAEMQALLDGDALAADSDAIPDPHLGLRLGAYQVDALIARGGMAAVYRAHRADDQFQQLVAVKIMDLRLSDADLVARFKVERQLLATLEHPAVTRLLDGGRTALGEPYLVMEYVDGVALDRYCDRERLNIAARVGLFLEVCGGVAFAHGQRVVHRDLKPSNLLVTREGHVKVVDFGTAALLEPDRLSTVSRAPLTPAYASPEQLTGRPVGATSDQYSLGLVLYELLSGAPAFREHGSLMASMERALSGTRPTTLPDAATATAAELRQASLPHLRESLSGDLDVVVSRALAADPADRYESVQALAEDLRLWMEGASPVGVARGRRTRRQAIFTSWVLGLAAVLALVVSLVWPASARSVGAAAPAISATVAVLPLVNLTDDATMDPLIDGLSDELTNDLARVPALRVTARSSAFVFRQTARDLRNVGRTLGVNHLLQGTVAKEGERLKVNLRLVRSDDGREAWSRAFVVPATTLFQIPARVTRAVVAVVGTTPVAAVGASRAPTRPRNAAAFDAYIRALFAHRSMASGSWTEAERSSDECIRLEPSFAGCHTLKGVALFTKVSSAGGTPDPADRAAAEDAFRTALTLDPNDGVAHANLGGIAMLFDFDWPRARDHYETAIRLSPLAAEAYAGGLLLAGHGAEAEAFYLRAKDIDPMSLAIRGKLAITYGMTGRLDAALATLDDLERMSPDNLSVQMQRAWLHVQQGDLTAARATFARVRARSPQLPELQLADAWVAAVSGQPGALAAIDAWDAAYGAFAPYSVGLAYLHAGRPDLATPRILAAIGKRDMRAAFMVLDPALDPLRRRPEFRAVWDAVPNLTVDAVYPGGWPPPTP